jgi:hypothetical protein
VAVAGRAARHGEKGDDTRGEEAGGGRRDLSEARKGQAEEAGSSVQGKGGRWEETAGKVSSSSYDTHVSSSSYDNW